MCGGLLSAFGDRAVFCDNLRQGFYYTHALIYQNQLFLNGIEFHVVPVDGPHIVSIHKLMVLGGSRC